MTVRMDSHNLQHLLALYFAVVGFCHGSGVLPKYLNGTLGENVTIPVNDPPAQPFTVTWTFNTFTTIIISRPNGNSNIGPGYEGRITLDRSTGTLGLMNLVVNDSGDYSVSLVTNEGLPHVEASILKVYETISGATITSPNPPIIEGNSVTLSCDASGAIITREWMKDGQLLSAGGNIFMSENKRVLSINPVKRTDSGEYLCRVSNPISSADAKHGLIVNYGPDGMEIMGPSEIEVGQKFTLTCSADSNPPASYTWMLNGTEIQGHSPEFTKEKSEYSDSVNYTCTATNDVTGNKTSVVHKLSVKAEGSLTPVLPAGAIAGIVIGVLLVVGVAGGVAVYFMKKNGCFKKESSSGRSVGNTGKSSANGERPGGTQDLNYADITQFQKRDGGSVQLGNLGTSSTEYAQVRVNNRSSQPA